MSTKFGLEGEEAERREEASSAIVLTRRESMQLLDMIENPRPRSERFEAAMARYKVLVEGERSGGRDE